MDPINSNSNLIPLEREYEGWIIANIENYFETLGIRYFIRALSPNEEKNFPADELLQFPNSFKLIGIQMKRPKFRQNQNNPKKWSDLIWEFYNPSHQYPEILNNKNIYYCLPAFTNRAFRKNALSHCYFWRPSNDTPKTYCLKGDNDINGSVKWKEFIDLFNKCEIGQDYDSAIVLIRDYNIKMVLSDDIRNDNEIKESEYKIINNNEKENEEDSVLYLIGVEIFPEN